MGTQESGAGHSPWDFDDEEFYELASFREEMQFLIRYAVLAPSSHNTQPWAFRVTDEGVEVHADYNRSLHAVDPGARELLMSVGAAIANLRVAAAHFGFETAVEYARERVEHEPVARIACTSAIPDPELAILFRAIRTRRTSRRTFRNTATEPEIVGELCDFLEKHDIRVLFHEVKGRVAELVAEADRIQFQDAATRKELAAWIRFDSKSEDGILIESIEIPDAFAGAGPSVIRHADLGSFQASKDREHAENAEALLILTGSDDLPSLLRTGEILERLLLTLTRLGFQYSFLNQPIQIRSLRKELWALVRSETPPQILLRIGHSDVELPQSPRRPVEAVMAN